MKEPSKKSSNSARNLKKSVPHRTVGGFNVHHINPFPVEYESYNERNTTLLLALCHDVSSIRSQPVVFDYVDKQGKHRKHTPDFEETSITGEPLYLEVKALEDLLKPQNIAKYIPIAKEYYRQGVYFRFLTNIQIENQPVFQAVKLLFRYVNSVSSLVHLERAQHFLNDGAMPIVALMEKAQMELRDVYTLMAKRQITFDLSKPLNRNSYISLPNQPYGGITLEAILCSTRYGDLLQKLALGHQPTDKSLLAAAKNWRQSNNHADVWSVVGDFAELPPLRDASSSGFLRGPKLRRAFAPGIYHPQITVE
ncbi:TnsA endonuclease N-terminal domain-containing protein [Methylophilus sp. 14]|uniref:TnsA endonuclease N-terminal domain-containing protein n=1 Tax=Methylophilus sp. 14 TaxID=2781019 RepID=UPI00188E7DBA|nr:TnsA endonuclease N-terminal domain-containing protein [Methylophilus sp. 14]MBF4987063.1 Tn7 transposase TnsA N-terminal domain-containing protein [Methylophilus sp. 14]